MASATSGGRDDGGGEPPAPSDGAEERQSARIPQTFS